MNNHKVYLHLNRHGIPFYVGIGTGNRPYSSSGRPPGWREESNESHSVFILKRGLSKKEALIYETFFITLLVNFNTLKNIKQVPYNSVKVVSKFRKSHKKYKLAD